MADLTGKVGYSTSGKTVFATNSQNVYFQKSDKRESILLASYGTSKQRSFMIVGDGNIYVDDDSTFESLDIDDIKDFEKSTVSGIWDFACASEVACILLIAGFPCKDLSGAKRRGLGLDVSEWIILVERGDCTTATTTRKRSLLRCSW